MRSASAMPTAFARPWPSGPVVVSTPGGGRIRGGPASLSRAGGSAAARRSSCRRSRSDAAARRAASSRGRRRARSGRGPANAGSRGSNLTNSVNSTVAMSAMPIGRPGWPDFAFSTASIASARTALARRRWVGTFRVAFIGRTPHGPACKSGCIPRGRIARGCKSFRQAARVRLSSLAGRGFRPAAETSGAKRSGGEGAMPEEALGPDRRTFLVSAPSPSPAAQACCLRQPSPRMRGEADPAPCGEGRSDEGGGLGHRSVLMRRGACARRAAGSSASG